MRIVWSARASHALDKAISYGIKNFGEKVVASFYQHVKSYDSRLSLNPHLGSPEPLLAGSKRLFRSLVVHKHYKLVYWIDEPHDRLYIVDLWDTRREPSKLAGGMSGGC